MIFLLQPIPSLAFNPNYIISDQELTDYNSMTADDIQQFFIDHGSFLAYYDAIWPDTGLDTRANDIIWLAAQKFQINPKFLLVLLEKEQSLISIQKPPKQKRLTWALGYAVCDRCSLKHPLVAKYGGFGNQIYYAASKIRNTFLADLEKNGATHSGIGPGITKKIDRKHKVTPANNATSVLYAYTPHIAGNKNFFMLWNRWFSDVVYPDGSLLQDEASGGVYLISSGAKRPIASKGVLVSRFGDDEIIPVSRRIIDSYPDGPPVTSDDAGHTGSLIQTKNGDIYLLADNIKYPILDKALIAARFPKYAKTKVSDEEAQTFDTGDPIKFPDGTLLKSGSGPDIYFVSDGKIRPIPSEDIFLAYNWKWENVIKTTDEILELYEIGDPITLQLQLESDDLPPAATATSTQSEPDIAAN